VRVQIDGKPLAISFISPTQINFQTPNATEPRDVDVEIITPLGVSTFRATLVPQQPGLFLMSDGRSPAAVRADGSVVGPSAIPGARPARPNEVISLFGTGFGPTNPEVYPGRVFSGAAPTVNAVSVRIGGRPATVLFAGLSGAGLYQLNVQVPDLPAGTHAIEVTVGGAALPAGPILTVNP
jgi:uncharacterized protein (TIGR03437 family)